MPFFPPPRCDRHVVCRSRLGLVVGTNARQHGYYVPTPRAMAGGAFNENPFTNYSATVVSNPVGPEGGQVLVDRTVEAIQELWK